MSLPVDVVIIVFGMHDCPACQQFLPRLYDHIEKQRLLGQPFVVHQMGAHIEKGTIPILVYDVASEDPGVQRLADKHQVSALPSTIVLPKYGAATKWEGNLDDASIYQMFGTALALR